VSPLPRTWKFFFPHPPEPHLLSTESFQAPPALLTTAPLQPNLPPHSFSSVPFPPGMIDPLWGPTPTFGPPPPPIGPAMRLAVKPVRLPRLPLTSPPSFLGPTGSNSWNPHFTAISLGTPMCLVLPFAGIRLAPCGRKPASFSWVVSFSLIFFPGKWSSSARRRFFF